MSTRDSGNGYQPDRSDPGCAIVTGGSRGLGLGIAEALAEAGRPVVLAARGMRDLTDAAAKLEAKGGEVLAVQIDITDGHTVGELARRAEERFGRIDVLVNNAGAPPVIEELDRLSWERWRKHIDVDVRGIFNTAQRVGPLMREQGHGTIVNVASGAVIAATRLHVSYSPAQAAIVALSRCMNDWLEPDVTVHSLCPALTPAGGVGTAAATALAAEDGVTMDEWLEQRFGGSLTDANDIGAAIVALTGKPAGATWYVGADGLEEWNSILSWPVKA